MEQRWRILAIDDDPDVLDLIRMKLMEHYDVLCIDKPTDVSNIVDMYEPDLIILDIMLPKISGYQVIEYLKRNPKTADVPVCFLSAKASARDLKHGYKIGAALYLTKPFQPDRLLKNVKLFFDRTPPRRRGKRSTIEQINEHLKPDEYYVATAEAPTPAPEPEKAEPPPPKASSDAGRDDIEEMDDGETRYRRWEG